MNHRCKKILLKAESYPELLLDFQERVEHSIKGDGFIGVKVHLAEQVGFGTMPVWEKEAAIKYLFDKKLGRFLRSITVDTNGVVEPDYTIDSSICAPFLFGMLQATDPLIESTMAVLMDRLWCKTEVGGIARYENDRYQQVSQDIANIPGNPWFICTMWIAEYYIAKAQSVDDLKPALQILNWAQHHALLSGILAEQVHPYSHAPLSVSPLTWSHAAVVIAIHEYIDKHHELQA